MKKHVTETMAAPADTLLFTLLLLPVFYILIPYVIHDAYKGIAPFDIGIFRYSGLVFITLGGVIYLSCSSSFVFSGRGTPMPFTTTKKLVVSGLYKYVRNPIYIAGSLVLTGEALIFQSLPIFIYLLIMFGMFHWVLCGGGL
jgi:protein-S-isoprenylcysteine O-methyltransferase Ste14